MNFLESLLGYRRKAPKPKTKYVCTVHGEVSVMVLGNNNPPFCMRCAGAALALRFPVEKVEITGEKK